MPNSMTAYSQTSKQTAIGDFDCELRSVNHRYLDIAFRLPEELRSSEVDLRALISKSLDRGRLDCSIRYSLNSSSDFAANLDQQLATQVMSLAQYATEQWPSLTPLRSIDLLRWPGVLRQPQVDKQQLAEVLTGLIQQALDELINARKREGEALKQLMLKRLDLIEAEVEIVGGIIPEIRQKIRQRLADRVAEVLEKIDQERIEQEMVILLQKSDITEEIDRLMVHCREVRSVLDSSKPIGRRLDFLMQELNREANTLGSKAVDTRLSQASVELKVLIEQMREQVQNLE